MEPIKFYPNMMIFAVPNLYGSARVACRAWTRGRMWGNPIRMGAADHFHVYGALRGEWIPMWAEFLPDKIYIVFPEGLTCSARKAVRDERA